MEVVALVSSADHASTRYRIGQFACHLENAGLPLRMEILADSPSGRFRQMSKSRPNQIVFLQRKLIPLWQLALLRRSARYLVYDFDDAVFWRDSFHSRGAHSAMRYLRFRAIAKLSDLIFAGNSFLADTARRVTNPKKVEFVPTCVDGDLYQPAVHQSGPALRLVWIGCSSSLQALEHSQEVWRQVAENHPDISMRVISDRFPKFDRMAVEPVSWSSSVEKSALRTADIGVSWLPHDSWSRGKCGLKVLQYMAAGLPVIANPVGVHNDIVCQEQGAETGFLPTTPQDWVEVITRLREDVGLRQRIGQRARQRLLERYSTQTWGSIVAERLHKVAS